MKLKSFLALQSNYKQIACNLSIDPNQKMGRADESKINQQLFEQLRNAAYLEDVESMHKFRIALLLQNVPYFKEKYRELLKKIIQRRKNRRSILVKRHLHITRQELATFLEEDLEVSTDDLIAIEEKIKSDMTDALTGLYNRKKLSESVELYVNGVYRHIVDQLKNNEAPFDTNDCIFIGVDLDHFKSINDSLGHEAGDDKLRNLAHIMQKHAQRTGDLVIRTGGEEFTIVLPNTSLAEGQRIAEEIRSDVEKNLPVQLDKGISGTASMGISSLYKMVIPNLSEILDSPSLATELMNRCIMDADGALYHSKGSGRNRITTSPGVWLIEDPKNPGKWVRADPDIPVHWM